MSKIKLFFLSTAVAVILGLTAVVFSPNAFAQGENLLTNPGFEGEYSTFTPIAGYQQDACQVGVCTTAQMPAGWLPWWVPQTEDDEPWFNRMPEYKPVCPYQPCPYPDRLHSGTQALQYFTFHSTHQAGAYQQVSVAPGTNLKFSIMGQAWSSATSQVPSDFPTVVNMRIGIDPTGEANPFSPNIVWSGFANPYDNYAPFEVEATAQADRITVFLWSNPQEARQHNDIYWDSSSLVATGSSPVAASGGSGGGSAPVVAAAPIVLGPTPTPNADGEILVQVQPGDTMWNIAARASITLDELLDFNGLSRTDFINAGDVLLVGYGEAVVGEPEAESAESEEASSEASEAGEAEGDTAVVAADGAPANEDNQAETVAVAAVAETPAEETGSTICLRAFDDANQDGQFNAGESLRASVAFTLSDGQNVISNYVTDGASEPYCIDGLPDGNYRISRSFATNEVATNASDQAVTLSSGSQWDFDFGSVIEQSSAAEEVAMVNSSDTDTSGTASNSAAATSTTTAAVNDGGISTATIIVGLIVAIAAILFIGVLLIVLSARRTSTA